MNAALLEVTDLQKRFTVNRRQGLRTLRETVRAVDGVDLRLQAGETFGLVGESGCGKSTAGRAILRLIEPSGGTVRFEGVDLLGLGPEALRQTRRRLGMVFQDPMSALNPRMSVGEAVAEPLIAHRLADRKEARDRVATLLAQVGLEPSHMSRYPHEFSGGQRQRIGIARAIATEPRLLVLDEPISALDVSVRAQVLNLLMDLQESLGMAYLLIAHDLSVVRHACSRVAVMYLGIIVEEGPAETLFSSPLHPYTRALAMAAPSPDPTRRAVRAPLQGDVPTSVEIPSGCRFRTRCPLAVPRCTEERPPLIEAAPGRRVACFRAGEAPEATAPPPARLA
jgi:oligopeptide/dipeptide ABC transporter ATP-binding protein